MKTYEEKKKASENFPPGAKCLVEIENVKDPKENPFKQVRNFLILLKFFNFREQS